MNNQQFYLNQNNIKECIEIPSRQYYLNKNNHLSEFYTQEDKEAARQNLGIPDIIQSLKNVIDAKVIRSGGVVWDLEPTENHNEQALSSGVIYNTLLNYVKKEELDESIQEIWRIIVEYINTNIQENFNNQIQEIKEELRELSTLIHSMAESGVVLSDQFGDEQYFGINQRTLTKAINDLWDKIESITGESDKSINMIVTPSYYIGENGCDVNISADTQSKFEHISIYANGTLIDEAENTDTFNTTTHVDETTTIKCVAKILGVNYEVSKVVTHYNNYFLFAGQFDSLDSMVDYALEHPETSITLPSELRGSYDVTCNNGDNIIIVLGESLYEGLIRVDLNGIEIPFNLGRITVNNTNYIVLISSNTYNSGTYNIDING